MMGLQIIKKFTNLSPEEEKSLSLILSNSEGALKIITDYLEIKIIALDRKLLNPTELYDKSNSDGYIGWILAERASYINLHNVLTNKKEILDDDLGDK